MAGKVSKAAFDAKMWNLLKEYSQVVVVTSDNVGSNQINRIRRSLKGDSVVVMGKNSMMKRSFTLQAGNNSFLNLIPLLRGNIALIFTKGDMKEVSNEVAKLKVVDPLLMCSKYLSYESYRNCSYMQSNLDSCLWVSSVVISSCLVILNLFLYAQNSCLSSIV
ncbi:60s acidic ribosomal protein P2 [Stylosanthes scabra]|uniref:60s acidic ribosomal protein P2 n=1 Tax=Stylosanthes scabra TaxID=79078 RepID=A0ABU6WVL3_9FABA|nr:60s acidic ribosomal protein P2 [Stylosanthes scabra]